MTTITSQITSLAIVYSIVYSDADQRKHQSSASLAFVWGIHRDREFVGNSPGPVNSPHKGPATRKMFPFNDVIMVFRCLQRLQCRRSTQNDNCPVFGGSINHLWCHCSLLWRHNDPHCHSIVCYCGYINNNRIVYVDYLIEPSASGASTPQGMYPRLLLTDSINPLWRLSAY